MMKKIFYLLTLLLFSTLSQAQTVGIKIAAPMIKNDPADNTITGYSHLIARGYIPRLTTAGRDSLVTYFSKVLGDGLFVFTRDTEKYWRWKSSNSTWEEITMGSSGPVAIADVTGLQDSLDNKYSKSDIDAIVSDVSASIPAQFVPIAGTNISLTGTYPNITFNAAGGTNQNHTPGYGLSGSIYDGSTARTWTVDTAGIHGLVSKDRLDWVNGGLLHTTGNEFKTGNLYFEGGITAYDTFSAYPYTQVDANGVSTATIGTVRGFLNPDGLSFQNGNSYMGKIQPGTLTDDRTYTLPNSSGTIALTSDLPSTPTTLDDVLTNGNTSTQNAALGGIIIEDALLSPDTKSLVNPASIRSENISTNEATSITPAGLFLEGTDGNWYSRIYNDADLTANRDIKVPDASGTLALTSDIPSVSGYAPLASPTFTGTVTLPNTTLSNNVTATGISINNSGGGSLTTSALTTGTANLTGTVTLGSVSTGTTSDAILVRDGSNNIRQVAASNYALASAVPAQFNPIAGTNISLSGTYPNITFNASGGGGGGGTVTSITPGFGFTSSTPITTSGTIVIDTTVIAQLKGVNEYLMYKTASGFESTGLKWDKPNNTYIFEAYDVAGDGGAMDATVNANVIKANAINNVGSTVLFGGPQSTLAPTMIFHNDTGFALFGNGGGGSTGTDAYGFFKPTMADRTTTGTGTASGWLFKVNGGVGTRAIPAGSSSSASTGGTGALVSIASGNGGAFSGNTTNTGRGGAGGAYSLLSGTGGAAANAGAGTQIGGAGGAYSITTGNGGAATNASATTGTGGAAGALSITAGVGGAATSTTTSTGGAGGTTTIASGSGGNATAGTTRTGGDAGDIVFTTGTGGTGTTANGRDGRMIFPIKTAPATATSTGTAGEIRFTTSGIYICTATNTWIKCTGATF